jgi:hypothetical protein
MIKSTLAIFLTVSILSPIGYTLGLLLANDSHTSFIEWIFLILIATISGFITSKIIEKL